MKFLLGLIVVASPLLAQTPLNQRVLVVYNSNFSDSLDVANYYIAQRGIPAANLCAISPQNATQIAPTDMDNNVKAPIKTCLNRLGPANILYIVFTYLTPFGYTDAKGIYYAIDQAIADIWDQYLTQNPWPFPLTYQPYYADAQSQGNVYVPFVSLAGYRNQTGAATIYSVWRLDGATSVLAKGLVDKAIQAEASGLTGQTCIDRRFGDLTTSPDFGTFAGDWDLHKAAQFAATAGFALTEDANPTEFGTPPAPLRCDNAALYSGWYSFNNYNNAFTWNTGAIGFHLDSGSALDPRGHTNWSANAIINGITVTSGSVAEPYLEGLLRPDGVFHNLFEGADVGDAFARNTAWLKWMILNFGDPLYRPFPNGFTGFNPPVPQNSFALNPPYPIGGHPVTATLSLANPAPAGGAAFTLSSANPSVASVPATITVPAGSSSANFTVTTSQVTAPSVSVILNANYGSLALSNTVTVVPLLGYLYLNPSSVSAGTSSTGTVILNDVAPPGGVSISLTSANPAVARVPAKVTVPQGSLTANFSITTFNVSSNTNVVITSSYQGASVTATLTVTPSTALPPTADSVTPNSGTGASQVFAFAFSDPAGFANLTWEYISFGTSTAPGHACYVSYSRVANALYLRNDAGSKNLGPLSPGANSTLQNSQCTLNAASSSVSGSGNTLTLNVSLSFQPAFTGAKNIYMKANDKTGLTSGWQTRGTWTP